MRLASSSSVISCGLPRLTGSVTGARTRRHRPSIRSEMYWNERVCEPSPKTVNGRPASACEMNAGIARPSSILIRGPKQLKMRAIRVSTPWERAVHPEVLGHVVAHQAEPGPRLEGRDVLRRPGDEVVHADDLPALVQEELAEVGADETRATRDQRPHRGRQAGSTGLRPIEWYSKPKRRIRSGSQRFRPSKTTGRRMTARSRSRLRNLNS